MVLWLQTGPQDYSEGLVIFVNYPRYKKNNIYQTKYYIFT